MAKSPLEHFDGRIRKRIREKEKLEKKLAKLTADYQDLIARADERIEKAETLKNDFLESVEYQFAPVAVHQLN